MTDIDTMTVESFTVESDTASVNSYSVVSSAWQTVVPECQTVPVQNLSPAAEFLGGSSDVRQTATPASTTTVAAPGSSGQTTPLIVPASDAAYGQTVTTETAAPETAGPVTYGPSPAPGCWAATQPIRGVARTIMPDGRLDPPIAEDETRSDFSFGSGSHLYPHLNSGGQTQDPFVHQGGEPKLSVVPEQAQLQSDSADQKFYDGPSQTAPGPSQTAPDPSQMAPDPSQTAPDQAPWLPGPSQAAPGKGPPSRSQTSTTGPGKGFFGKARQPKGQRYMPPGPKTVLTTNEMDMSEIDVWQQILKKTLDSRMEPQESKLMHDLVGQCFLVALLHLFV
ncbi:unnamed protein product [Symbiodinium sp. CCMP2592]|nr:unnamed protein product [Symbiodinium sp. CCMP2592]